MSISFEMKFYQFEYASAIFNIATTISRLKAIENSATNHEKNYQKSEEPIYERIVLQDEFLYYHIASAFLCFYLYHLQTQSKKPKEDFYTFILNVVWQLDCSYEECDNEIKRIVDETWNDCFENKKNFIQAFENYLLYDSNQQRLNYDIEEYSEFDRLIVFNRIVHDNLMLCLKNDYISKKISDQSFNSAKKRIFGDDIVKKIIDRIIVNNKQSPPSGGGNGKAVHKRSSCFAQVYTNGVKMTYLAISGFWDRILSKDPSLRTLCQTKKFLKPTSFEREMKRLIISITKINKWEYCFLDTYTESYYSLFDEHNQDKYVLSAPLHFIDDLIRHQNDKIYPNKRLFSCGERKIISFMENDISFLNTYKGKINGIIFYVDREPCTICKKSFMYFQNALGLKWLKIEYVDKTING